METSGTPWPLHSHQCCNGRSDAERSCWRVYTERSYEGRKGNGNRLHRCLDNIAVHGLLLSVLNLSVMLALIRTLVSADRTRPGLFSITLYIASHYHTDRFRWYCLSMSMSPASLSQNKQLAFQYAMTHIDQSAKDRPGH